MDTQARIRLLAQRIADEADTEFPDAGLIADLTAQIDDLAADLEDDEDEDEDLDDDEDDLDDEDDEVE